MTQGNLAKIVKYTYGDIISKFRNWTTANGDDCCSFYIYSCIGATTEPVKKSYSSNKQDLIELIAFEEFNINATTLQLIEDVIELAKKRVPGNRFQKSTLTSIYLDIRSQCFADNGYYKLSVGYIGAYVIRNLEYICSLYDIDNK